MRRELLLLSCCLVIPSICSAQEKTEPWNDPLVNNINRNEPVSDFFGYENKELLTEMTRRFQRDSCQLKEIGNSIGCRMPMSVL